MGLKYPATKFQPFQILTFFHDSNAEPIAVQIEIVGKTEHHDSTISIVNFPGYCSSTTYFKKVIQGLIFKLVSNLKTEVAFLKTVFYWAENVVSIWRPRETKA